MTTTDLKGIRKQLTKYRKMNQEKQLQYYAKVNSALSTLFEKENENFIDVFDEEFSANEFFHVLATRVPQRIMAKLTGHEYDPLEFNHVCNKLIVQDIMDNNKEQPRIPH